MRAPRLPRFILLVGFGDMAYDSYLVAAFAVLGRVIWGGGELLLVPVGEGAVSGVGCSARGCLAFRGLSCWWASVAWSVVAVCGPGGGGGLSGGVSGWIINSSCGRKLCLKSRPHLPRFILLVRFSGTLLVVSIFFNFLFCKFTT